jgi:hypothetical protein
MGSDAFLHAGLISCHHFAHSLANRSTFQMSGLPDLARCTQAPTCAGLTLVENPFGCENIVHQRSSYSK